jgi:hypothetical protein
VDFGGVWQLRRSRLAQAADDQSTFNQQDESHLFRRSPDLLSVAHNAAVRVSPRLQQAAATLSLPAASEICVTSHWREAHVREWRAHA